MVGGQWKQRNTSAGVLFFNRTTGANILLDEIVVPLNRRSTAPRQISIALTNRCDLACAHCYAMKSRHELPPDRVLTWLTDLDKHGTLGVGFGGGEPTLFPNFSNLCRAVTETTSLAVTFTTHGHHIDEKLANELKGSVQFIRVSMDGTGATYEAIRGRSFPSLVEKLSLVRSISRFGINVVVDDTTLKHLDDVALIAADTGASELLLLPKMQTSNVECISGNALSGLMAWVDAYNGPLTLCINETYAESFPTCNPLAGECGLLAYAHIDALGILKTSSYHKKGVLLGAGGIMQALNQLTIETMKEVI